MGANGVRTLLGIADMTQHLDQLPPDDLQRQFDFAKIAALNHALEEMYGVKGGRGMALRIGQSVFVKGMKDFGVMRAMINPTYRSLPLPKRFNYGLRSLAAVLTNFSDQTSHVDEDGSAMLFTSEMSPYAWGRTSDKPVCHMMVGIIMEALRWSTNGYDFYVREIACTASGSHECIFRVNRHAIGERHT